MVPRKAKMTIYNDADSIEKAYLDYKKIYDNTQESEKPYFYKKEQFCHLAFGTEDTISTGANCTFRSASEKRYKARLYCKSTDPWFYKSLTETNFTAPFNGGKLIKSTITYTRRSIDDITHNEQVLKIACSLSSYLQIPNERVGDAYGGICDSKGLIPTRYI